MKRTRGTQINTRHTHKKVWFPREREERKTLEGLQGAPGRSSNCLSFGHVYLAGGKKDYLCPEASFIVDMPLGSLSLDSSSLLTFWCVFILSLTLSSSARLKHKDPFQGLDHYSFHHSVYSSLCRPGLYSLILPRTSPSGDLHFLFPFFDYLFKDITFLNQPE